MLPQLLGSNLLEPSPRCKRERLDAEFVLPDQVRKTRRTFIRNGGRIDLRIAGRSKVKGVDREPGERMKCSIPKRASTSTASAPQAELIFDREVSSKTNDSDSLMP